MDETPKRTRRYRSWPVQIEDQSLDRLRIVGCKLDRGIAWLIRRAIAEFLQREEKES